MRLLIFAFTILSFATFSYSQLNHQQGIFQVSCSEILFDEGGPSGNYSDNTTDTMMLIFPDYVTEVHITFPFWDMEVDNYDTVSFYSGIVGIPSLIGHYATASPPPLVIPNDTIIIIFNSDAGVNEAGFEMNFQGLYEGGNATPSDVTCFTQHNGSITLNGAGFGSAPYTFSIDSSASWQSNATFSGLSPGTYDDLIIRDFKGCYDTIDVITVGDLSTDFTIDAEVVTDVTCFGQGNGSIQIDVSGSSGNFDFAWSDATIDENVVTSTNGSLAPGNYWVRVSDAGDTNCFFTQNYVIDQPSIILVSTLIQDTISCNGECDGSILVTMSGGTSPYEYSDDNGATFQSGSLLDSLCDGTYDVVVRDANGCSLTPPAVILTEPTSLTLATTPTDPTDFGLTDGSITTVVGGGTTPYSYVWNTFPAVTTSDLTNVGAGIYLVTVTDSNGCQTSHQDTLSDPATLDPGAIRFTGGGTVQNVCSGGNSTVLDDSVSISGGAGAPVYTWQWSSNFVVWNDYAASNSATFGPVPANGILFIRRRVVDGSQTAYSNVLLLDEIDPVTASIAGLFPEYCENEGDIVLTGSPQSAASYFNVDAGANQVTTTLTIDPTTLAAGSHTVSYTYVDPYGCSNSVGPLSFDVYDTTDIELNFGQSEYLVSDSTISLVDELSTGIPAGTYSFSGPGASGDSLYFNIAGLGTHSYSFTFTNTNGCSSTSSESITIIESTAINGLGDFKFCVTEGNIPIDAVYPDYQNYGISPQSRFRFRIKDYDLNTHIGSTCLQGGDAWHNMTGPNDSVATDVIYLNNLPLTPGQWVDTFIVMLQYKQMQIIPFPFSIQVVDKWITRQIYVEHIDSIGGFSNLTSPYCINEGQSNIIIQDQSPTGGAHDWDILTILSDGLTGINLSGVTFDPLAFGGLLNTDYTLQYTLTSPLGTCVEQLTSTIRVDSVPTISLSAYPTELCLGQTFTLQGFISGLPGGTFFGNNIVDLTNGDGLAELNTNLTGPANNEPITFSYTDANGCLVDSTWLFTVNDTPFVSVTALPEICFEDSTMFTGTLNGIFSLGAGITDNSLGDTVWFNSGALLPDSSYAYSYTATNGFGCTGTVNSSIHVNELPIVGVSVDGTEFCSDETGIGVNPVPIPGPNDSLIYDGMVQTYNPSNNYPLDANILDTGQVVVEYIYRNSNGCKQTAYDTIIIYPTPDVYFTFGSFCIADTIHFQDSSTVNGATITDYTWWFTDFNGTMTSSAQDTSILFNYPATRSVRLTLNTAAGCSNFYEVGGYFGDKPALNFTWDNECMLDPSGTNTQFTDLTPVADGVDSMYWSFGDNTVPMGSDTSTMQNPSWNYTTIGQKTVTLYGSNQAGCEETITKTLWIRPYVQTYPYVIDFTSGSGGWIPDTVGLGDTISSWSIGIPDTTGLFAPITAPNMALTTAPNDNYYNNEYSGVVSPCFDFSALDRPMIKLSYALETDNNDGLNINYQDQNGDWQALGAPGQGINWFDGYTDGLNEPTVNGNSGWYQNTNGWVDARLRLDTIVGDTNVQFKVVFGSNAGLTSKGAAIDYIWIGERQRTVLCEHFTNYNHADAIWTTTYDTVVERPSLNRNGLDIISLEYHTSTEPNELINLNYQSGPSARMNYYGLDTVPYVINDGTSYRGNVNNWYANLDALESRTLVDPQFDIRLNVTQTSFDFTVQADFEAREDLGNTNVTVRMAIVEDSIDVNGNIYRNTVIDFLPAPSGRSFSDTNWLAGPTLPWGGAGQILNVTETKTITNHMMANPNSLDVVVWIQDNDTEEVYQAVSGKITALLGLEGVHEPDAPMDFILFPNPTNGASAIVLNNAFKERGQVWIHDASGRLVEQIQIDKFQETIDLDNYNYKNGMYFVSVISPDGQKMTKKMIVSKN